MRHFKIKAAANPHDPEWDEYFESRWGKRMLTSVKGRAAHIFKISFFTKGYIDNEAGHALVEDLAVALVKNKPKNLVYRISASDDYRTRAGLEGIGIY